MNRTPDWLKAIAPKLPTRNPYQKAFKPIVAPVGGISPYAPKTNAPSVGMAPPIAPPPSGAGIAPGSIEGQTGFTGTSSPTGEIRPMNRVNRKVDEGELVLNAQDTRNVGDMAMGLVALSRQGKLTPQVTNQIKGLLGQPIEQRMVTGSSTLRDDGVWRYSNGSVDYSGGTGTNDFTNITAFDQPVPPVTPPVIPPVVPPPVIPPVTTPPVTSIGNGYRNLALGRLNDISAGKSPLYAAMTNKLQQEEALRNAALQGEQRQSIAQRGLQGTGIAQAEQTAQRIEGSSNAAGLAAKTAQAQMGEMAGATNNLATMANTISQQERTDKIGAMNQLLTAKNYDGYAAAYKALYGTDIDVTALKAADASGNWNSSLSALNTELTRSNAAITDVGVQKALNDMWLNSGHTGPMDATWAQTQFDTYGPQAVDNVGSFMQTLTPTVLASYGLSTSTTNTDPANGIVDINTKTWTTPSGTVLKGMDAVRGAITSLLTNGSDVVWDNQGNWSLPTVVQPGSAAEFWGVLTGQREPAKTDGTAPTVTDWGTNSAIVFNLRPDQYEQWKAEFVTKGGGVLGQNNLPAVSAAFAAAPNNATIKNDYLTLLAGKYGISVPTDDAGKTRLIDSQDPVKMEARVSEFRNNPALLSGMSTSDPFYQAISSRLPQWGANTPVDAGTWATVNVGGVPIVGKATMSGTGKNRFVTPDGKSYVYYNKNGTWTLTEMDMASDEGKILMSFGGIK